MPMGREHMPVHAGSVDRPALEAVLTVPHHRDRLRTKLRSARAKLLRMSTARVSLDM